MRTALTFLGLLAVSSACGTWSNDDLAFLAAMPEHETLRAKLPTPNDAALSGTASRRDALGIGELSKLYADTKGASDGFNKILHDVIGILELVRTIPPTTRAQDQRSWGPWTDNDNPGFEVRVVVTRFDDSNFGYQFQHRPIGGEFFDTVSGGFKASSDLHRGQGGLTIHAAVAAQRLPSAKKDLDNLEKVELGYVTDVWPVSVNVVFTAKPDQAISTLSYGYQELKSKNARIGFVVTSSDANVQRWESVSTWSVNGPGFAIATVAEGAPDFKGATQFECWDASFKTVFVKQTWPGGVELGDARRCAAVEGFPAP